MGIAYLNGEYMPIEEARISPMDRGFLFGDGIYEVIPSYHGKLVGFGPHMDRMARGLSSIDIKLNWSHQQWREVAENLSRKNGAGDLGIYCHVSRGADTKRNHAYPDNISPTVFAFAFEIPPEPVADKALVTPYKVSSAHDMRWKRCNIKSTALLGNVMHYQQGHAQGSGETILFNDNNELTEGSAVNVYIVKNGVVATSPLDEQILPGITRFILLDVLRKEGSIKVEERVVSMDEVRSADEVWLTSSSKEIVPVIAIDGVPVADGRVGDVWLAAQTLFTAAKYNY